jgi:hypothetical protein
MLSGWPFSRSIFWSGLASASGAGSWVGRATAPEDAEPRSADIEPWVALSERAVAVARHPSFTPVVAKRLVQRLPRRDLLDVWNTTTGLLEGPLSSTQRLRYVVLRAAVIDEMERRYPRAFERWMIAHSIAPRGGRH